MNSKIESGIELHKEMLIFFIGEKLPMTVKVFNDDFAICTRKFNYRQDFNLMQYGVEMGAFSSIKEAHKSYKDEIVYSILDLKNGKRAPDNYGGKFDYKSQEEIDECLAELMSGETELSRRHGTNLRIDFERTINS